MKLNIGCGKRVLKGYTNVDAVANPGAPYPPELICSALEIPLGDNVADEIMAIHLFEHFYLWDAAVALREWRRLLKVGGQLILELPDIVKCAQNVVDNTLKGGKDLDQLGMWGLYGDPRYKDPFMCHRWGWSPRTIQPFLHSHGFTDVCFKPTQYHPAGRDHRDMRVEARKS